MDRPPGVPAGPAGPFDPLVVAMQFLTIAPLGLRRRASPAEIGRSMAYFPLVGAVLGLALSALDALADLAFGGPARAAVLVTATCLITRAIHLDGLMDSADGLFGGWTPERRLEIMRDSRVGSFGAVAVGCDLLLRFAALLAIPPPLVPAALVASAVLGRWSLVYSTAAYRYARPTGLGAAYRAEVGRLQVTLATASAAALLLATCAWGGWQGVIPFSAAVTGVVAMAVISWLVAALFGRYVLARLGGHTGDTYGATNEVVEIAALLAFGSPLLGWVAA